MKCKRSHPPLAESAVLRTPDSRTYPWLRRQPTGYAHELIGYVHLVQDCARHRYASRDLDEVML